MIYKEAEEKTIDQVFKEAELHKNENWSQENRLSLIKTMVKKAFYLGYHYARNGEI